MMPLDFCLGIGHLLAVSRPHVFQRLPKAAQYRLAQIILDLPDRSGLGAIGALYREASRRIAARLESAGGP